MKGTKPMSKKEKIFLLLTIVTVLLISIGLYLSCAVIAPVDKSLAGNIALFSMCCLPLIPFFIDMMAEGRKERKTGKKVLCLRA